MYRRPCDTYLPKVCKDTSASLRTSAHTSLSFWWWIALPSSAICIDELLRETACASVRQKCPNHIKNMHILHTLLHAVPRKKSSIRITDLSDMDQISDLQCVCAIVYHKADVLMCVLGTLCGGSWDGLRPWTRADAIGFGPLRWDQWALTMTMIKYFISIDVSSFSGNWWLVQFPTNVSHVQP